MKKIIIKVLAALLIVTPINIEVQALIGKEQYEVESTENVQENIYKSSNLSLPNKQIYVII